MDFELHAEAREEFLSAVSRYESEVSGLGARFIAEFDRVISLLLDAPNLGAPQGGKLRRFVIDDHFPYSIVYTVVGRTLYVVSVAHDARQPGYWKGLLFGSDLEKREFDGAPGRMNLGTGTLSCAWPSSPIELSSGPSTQICPRFFLILRGRIPCPSAGRRVGLFHVRTDH